MPHKSNGEFIDVEEVTLAASAARTESGSGSAIDLGDRNTLRLSLAITARSGTKPSLHALVETSADSSTWRQLGSFTAVNDATGTERQSFPGADRYVRLRWVISGATPSFTFSVSGDAALTPHHDKDFST